VRILIGIHDDKNMWGNDSFYNNRWEELPDKWRDNIHSFLVSRYRTPAIKLANINLYIQIRPMFPSGGYGNNKAKPENHKIWISSSCDVTEFNITLIHELRHLSWNIEHPYTDSLDTFKDGRFCRRFINAARRNENAAIVAEKKYGHLQILNFECAKHFWVTGEIISFSESSPESKVQRITHKQELLFTEPPY